MDTRTSWAGVHFSWFRPVTALLLLISTGCYSYVPVDFGTPEQGRQIRADLSEEGAREVVRHFGPGVRELRGLTLTNDEEGLSLLVDAIYGRQGSVPTEAQPIRITPVHVATIYERRLSKGRSALFGAGVIAAGFVLVESFASLGRQLDDDDGEPPGTQEVRIPREIGLRIPISW